MSPSSKTPKKTLASLDGVWEESQENAEKGSEPYEMITPHTHVHIQRFLLPAEGRETYLLCCPEEKKSCI